MSDIQTLIKGLCIAAALLNCQNKEQMARFVCGDEIQRQDEYLSDLNQFADADAEQFCTREITNIICPFCQESQSSMLGLMHHFERDHKIRIHSEGSESINEKEKLEKDKLNTCGAGADDSFSTPIADQRNVTSHMLQTLINMVPDMSQGILSRIHANTEFMLALARRPDCEAASSPQSTADLTSDYFAKELRERYKKPKLMKSQGVPSTMADDTNQAAEEMNMASIEDLPEEVLVEIMSYLNLADRKRSRLVCKLWHRLSYDKELIKYDWTNIRASEYLNRTSPNSRHLKITVHENDKLIETLPFWARHGQEVVAIDFECIKGDNEIMSNVLRYCPNVERIRMKLTPAERDRPRFSFPVVPLLTLEKLELNGDSLQNGRALVQSLFVRTPKLRELSTDVPGNIQSRRAILQLIKRHSATLEELDLNVTSSCSDEYLKQVIDTVDPKLTRLFLYDKKKTLTDSTLNAIVNKLVHLEELSLSNTRITPTAVECAILSLKNLTDLTISGIPLRNAPISFSTAINNWTQLAGLDLTMTNTTAERLISAFQSPHPKLTSLHIDDSAFENYDFLSLICPSFPNLIILGLNYFRLEDKHIKVISEHNGLLKDLTLYMCDVVNCPALNGMKNLEYLSLEHCGKCIGTVSALTLPKLHSIDLSSTETTSADILQLLARNPLLHRVEVSNDEELHPIFHDVMTDEIRGILESRAHPRPC